MVNKRKMKEKLECSYWDQNLFKLISQLKKLFRMKLILNKKKEKKNSQSKIKKKLRKIRRNNQEQLL